MKFTLEIELGNDAMQTLEDVEYAIRNLMKSGHVRNQDSHNIVDVNGNTVGTWQVSE